jgi:hypothetical protein
MLLTLIYCLITLVVGGLFKMCGVVFVDAKLEKGATAPRGPTAEA